MKVLEDRVTFYIPTDTDEGMDMAANIAKEASQVFGGSTMTPGVGHWQGKAESVTQVTVFVERQKRVEYRVWVRDVVRRIGQTLKQEAVLTDTNGVGGLWEKEVDYSYD